MKKLLVVLILSACHDELDMSKHCEVCRAEGVRSAQIPCFQARCDADCKPSPGVVDTSAPDTKNWRCGCLPTEKK